MIFKLATMASVLKMASTDSILPLGQQYEVRYGAQVLGLPRDMDRSISHTICNRFKNLMDSEILNEEDLVDELKRFYFKVLGKESFELTKTTSLRGQRWKTEFLSRGSGYTVQIIINDLTDHAEIERSQITKAI